MVVPLSSPLVSIIEIRGLHKHYGSLRAVDGIDLDVEEGEVFALLGPNGAGKSTTVEILEGHRTPTAGTVRVLDMDPTTAGPRYRDRIGIVLQQSGIEDELSVSEALEMYASVYSDPADPDEVLALVGLADRRDQRVRTLSGGQQRRIDLALGLIGKPEVLFLDEPTTGFDPAARRRSWDLVDGLKSLGTTILLTTHYMDEAQPLADRVAVIVRGQIVARGTPVELMESAGDTVISFQSPADSDLMGLPLEDAVIEEGVVTARTARPTETLHELTEWALSRSLELEDLSVTRPSLEDVYLELADPEGQQ